VLLFAMDKKYRQLIVLVSAMIIISVGQLHNISSVAGGLNAFDPWYHLHIAREITECGSYSGYIDNAVYKHHVDYITLLHPFSVIYSSITGVSIYNVFRYFSIFLLLLISLGVYIVVRRIADGKAAIVSMLLFASIPYIHYRTAMNIPENYNILFQLILFFTIVGLKGNIRYFSLPLVAISYFHYRALALPIFLILLSAFIMPFHPEGRARKIELLKLVILFLVLTFPIILKIFNAYSYYLSHQIGSNSERLAWTANPAHFRPLDFSRYLDMLGPFQLLLILYGMVMLLGLLVYGKMAREGKALCIILLAYITLLFAFTQGPRWGMYIKPYRFLGPMALPLSFISSLGIKRIFYFTRRSAVFLIIIPVLVLPLVLGNILVSNYSTLHPEDKEAFRFINHTYGGDTIMVSFGRFYNFFSLSPKSEYNINFIKNVFQMRSYEEMMNTLKLRYGNDKIVIVAVPLSWYGTLKSFNPQFHNIFDSYKVFDNGVRIYEFNT